MRHRKTLHKSLRRKLVTGTALMVIPQPEEEPAPNPWDAWPYLLYTIIVFGLLPLFLHLTGIRI